MFTKKSKAVSAVLVLLAAMIMMLGLTACSGSTETKSSTPSSRVEFLGTWERMLPDGVETIQMTA